MHFSLGAVRRMAGRCRRYVKGLLLRITDRAAGDSFPFWCPCCDLRLRDFADGGFTRSPELFDVRRYRQTDQRVVCPLCRSLPRHRILVSWMQEHLDEIREDRILCFAQERCVRMWMDRNGLSCTTADYYKPADLKINIEDTGLEGDSFDLIICNHVLEHVSDYQKALRELRRVIRPGKEIIVSFPVDPAYEGVWEDPSITDESGRIRAFGQRDHLRVFGRDSRRMLEKLGFDVEEIRGEDCDGRIKPVIGPADYDSNVLYLLRRREETPESILKGQ